MTFSKTTAKKWKNKRRFRKSAILTNSPEKQAVAEKQSKKIKLSVDNKELKNHKRKGKDEGKQGD